MRPAIKAGRPDAAVRQLEPSKSDRLGSGSGEQSTTDFRLLTQYLDARSGLDERVMLLDWSIGSSPDGRRLQARARYRPLRGPPTARRPCPLH